MQRSGFQPIQVIGNFYAFKVGQVINTYKIEISSEENGVTPESDLMLFLKIVSLHRKEFISDYGATHYRVSNTIYSPKDVEEKKYEDAIENATYKTVLRPTGILPN